MSSFIISLSQLARSTRHASTLVINPRTQLQALSMIYGPQSLHMKPLLTRKTPKPLLRTRKTHKTTRRTPRPTLRIAATTANTSNLQEPTEPPLEIDHIDPPSEAASKRSVSYVTRKDVGQQSIPRRNVISQERDSRAVSINTSRSTKERKTLIVK